MTTETKAKQIKSLIQQLIAPAAKRAESILKVNSTFNLDDIEEITLVNTSCSLILAFDESLFEALETLEEYNKKHSIKADK
jgi:tagatose-1,6-bisphosphate aldolase